MTPDHKYRMFALKMSTNKGLKLLWIGFIVFGGIFTLFGLMFIKSEWLMTLISSGLGIVFIIVGLILKAILSKPKNYNQYPINTQVTPLNQLHQTMGNLPNGIIPIFHNEGWLDFQIPYVNVTSLNETQAYTYTTVKKIGYSWGLKASVGNIGREQISNIHEIYTKMYYFVPNTNIVYELDGLTYNNKGFSIDNLQIATGGEYGHFDQNGELVTIGRDNNTGNVGIIRTSYSIKDSVDAIHKWLADNGYSITHDLIKEK